MRQAGRLTAYGPVAPTEAEKRLRVFSLGASLCGRPASRDGNARRVGGRIYSTG